MVHHAPLNSLFFLSFSAGLFPFFKDYRWAAGLFLIFFHYSFNIVLFSPFFRRIVGGFYGLLQFTGLLLRETRGCFQNNLVTVFFYRSFSAILHLRLIYVFVGFYSYLFPMESFLIGVDFGGLLCSQFTW